MTTRHVHRQANIELTAALPAVAQTYDVVIRNGRVIVPETRLDAVRNAGVKDGRIAALVCSALSGARARQRIAPTGHRKTFPTRTC